MLSWDGAGDQAMSVGLEFWVVFGCVLCFFAWIWWRVVAGFGG